MSRTGSRRPSRMAPRGAVVLRPQRLIRSLRIVRRLPSSGPGFLNLERFVARNLYADGGVSRPYRFEVLHRRGVDAVAILPFHVSESRVMVVCKVGFRPALFRRPGLRPPVPETKPLTSVIEAVAGSLEPGDRGESGITRRARAELFEETGLRPIGPALRLGAGFFPSHGQSTEKVHLRAFRVDPRAAAHAAGDGSVNEADSGTLLVEASRILRMCWKGSIADPKLEIGVCRLLRALRRRIPTRP